MGKQPITITVDDEIVLRQLDIVDAKHYFQLVDSNRKHLSQFGDVTAEKYPTQDCVLESITDPKNKDKLRFGIWASGVFVGSINLKPYENKKIMLGYWIGSQYEGKRYVSRSCRGLINYAFKVMKVNAVVADAHKDNTKSIIVLKRCGFEEVPEKANDNELFFEIVNHLGR